MVAAQCWLCYGWAVQVINGTISVVPEHVVHAACAVMNGARGIITCKGAVLSLYLLCIN